jgi:hypothetical protein
MAYGPNHYVIRKGVSNLAEGLLDAAQRALPREEASVHGEVLEVRREAEYWRLTLLDAQESERTLVATLPVQQAPNRPEPGYTIGLLGAFDVEFEEVDLTFQLIFRARGIKPDWKVKPARRVMDQEATIEQLIVRYPTRAPLLGFPRRIAVVTGGRNALPDFEKGLGRMLKEVEIVPERTPLEEGTAEHIAQAIWNAARKQPRPDAIVLTRGGGKKVMLERFSAISVLEAAAEVGFEVPLVVAVGHRRDRVAAERFAWRVQSTPEGAGDFFALEVYKAKKRAEARLSSEARIPPRSVVEDPPRIWVATPPVPATNTTSPDEPAAEAPRAGATIGRDEPSPRRRGVSRVRTVAGIISALLVLLAGVWVSRRLYGGEVDREAPAIRARASRVDSPALLPSSAAKEGDPAVKSTLRPGVEAKPNPARHGQ